MIAITYARFCPTMAVNVPLNNHLQSLDVDTLDEAQRQAARVPMGR
jgi:hypothetical protein